MATRHTIEIPQQVGLPARKLWRGPAAMFLLAIVMAASLLSALAIIHTNDQTAEAALLAEVKKLLASDGEAGDSFGWSAAISGDTAVVSAFWEDAGGDNKAGSAYVFLRDEGGTDNWGEVKKLIASDAQGFDEFGWSVAVSGDIAVVGAHQEDAGGNANAGAAYVFLRDEGGADNWGEVRKLTASDAQAGAKFGIGVSVDSNTIVVGADRDSGVGAAYIFGRNVGGMDNWGEVAKLTASDAQTSDDFGFGVSISGDTAVVGAPREDAGGDFAGAAYVFERNEGGTDNWGEVLKLASFDLQTGDLFGRSVAVSANNTVIGARGEDAGGSQAGAGCVFERNEGGADNWGEVKKLTASNAQAGDQLGQSIAISGDTAVVGAYLGQAGDVGVAYAYQRDQGGPGNWGEVRNLTPSDAQGGDNFGLSVAVSGNIAVVGAWLEDAGGSGAGAAYVFEVPVPTPTVTPTATLCPPEGCPPTSTPTITPTPTDSPTPTDTPPPTNTPTPTPAVGGPEMVLNIKGGDCDDPVRPTKCSVPAAETFTLSVDALTIPNGYALMQTYVDYDGTLIYKQQAIEDEIIWPDLDDRTAVRSQRQAGHVNHGGLTGIASAPASFYTGTLVEIWLSCPSASTSQTTIDLLPYDDPIALTFGSGFASEPGVVVIPKVGSLTINCVTPPPTSTPTPIPTPGPAPQMALNIKGGDCDDAVQPSACYVEIGATFTLSVSALGVPDAGYFLMQTYLAYDSGLTYNAQPTPLDEIVWPDVDPDVAIRSEPAPDTLYHGGLTSKIQPFPTSHHVGNLVQVKFECPSSGISQHIIDLLPYGHPVANTNGALFLEAGSGAAIVPEVGSLTVHCSPPPTPTPTMQPEPGDTDSDGCSDEQESGPDEMLGGQRDYVNPHDFYDVAGSNDSPPDGVIDLTNDILGVIQHYAPTGSEPTYDIDYDRGPSEGPNAWNMTAPDGVIDLSNDILGVIQQYFHSCQ